MLFLISIVYSVLEYYYQKILNKRLINFDITIFIKRLFILNKYLFNWTIEFDNNLINYNYQQSNKILALSNHPRILDGFFLYYYLDKLFPTHKIIFVIKKKLIQLPIIGSTLKNNCLYIERNFKNDQFLIEKQINFYMSLYSKIIIVIFPEGTTYCKETNFLSDTYCKNNNMKKFNNILCPRYKGTELINDIFKPDLIIDNTIYYLDDIQNKKTIYESDILNLEQVHRCKIITNNITNNKINKTNLYKLWYEKDNILTTEYNNIQNINEIINKYYSINSNLIKKNELMYQTSKLFLLLALPSYYIHGLFYGLNVLIVFITSYLYHKYNKFKLIDMIFSSLLIFQSYIYLTNLYSLIFMSLGILSYFIGLILYKIFNSIDLSIFFHNLLHIFCSMHLIIEAINKIFISY